MIPLAYLLEGKNEAGKSRPERRQRRALCRHRRRILKTGRYQMACRPHLKSTWAPASQR